MTKPRLADFTRQLALTLICLAAAQAAQAQPPGFSYQGRLTDGGVAANGVFDLRFILYDMPVGGAQQGPIITLEDVAVANGIFTVSLDFGAAAFPGAARWLEIGVRPGASVGVFTLLSPRQPIISTPYAIRSLNAGTAALATQADGLSVACVNCVTSGQIGGVNGSQISGAIPVASVPAGSGNYVQNTTTPQAASNFNISGNGTAGGTLSANVVNTETQYNIGGSRVLSIASGGNTYAGVNAGSANTTGDRNAFFGHGAGAANTTAGGNSFFGSSAGAGNVTGVGNSYFGNHAGQASTGGSNNTMFGINAGTANTASDNAFFGADAGAASTTGIDNAFFGMRAGRANTTGNYNAFFGRTAGDENTTGSLNAFFGRSAGGSNTTGSHNAFFGNIAGFSNTTGDHNTVLGQDADLSAGNLTYATAIGSDAVVTSSARIQLGRDGIDTVRIGHLSGATATHLCISGNNVLSSCSSSQRYKQNVQPLRGGLSLIGRLRPVTFDWKERQEADLGLIAEEVGQVEPLLVTRNRDGVIEGVKYDQLSVVLINAVKEQQQEIEQLRAAKAELEQRLSALENLVRQNRSTKQARRRSAR